MLRVFELVMGLVLMFLISRTSMNHKGRALSYGGVYFGVLFLYFIIPIIDILFLKEVPGLYLTTIQNASAIDYFLYVLLVLLFFLVFTLSYDNNKEPNANVIEIHDEENQDIAKRLYRITRFIGWFCLAFGGIALVIYIIEFGGVANLLAHANLLRSFTRSGTDYVSYFASIMVIPARLITVSPIMFLAHMDLNTTRKPVYMTAFIVSMIGTVIFLFSNAGKAPILIMAMTLVYPVLANRFKHPWRMMILCGIIASPILGVLDDLFVVFASGDQMNYSFDVGQSLMSYIPDLSYESANVLNCQKIVDQFGLRWGQDYITGFLNLIPGVNFSVSYTNTSQFYGGNNWERIGGTPIDIITFGYVELSVLGVIINACILGRLCRKVDSIISELKGNNGIEVLKAATVLSFYNVILSSDISGIVRSQFTLLAVIICAYYLTSDRNVVFRLKRRRTHK